MGLRTLYEWNSTINTFLKSVSHADLTKIINKINYKNNYLRTKKIKR